MTSTPVNLLSLRSSQASDRPLPATTQLGQLAVDYGAAEPGVYFEDSAGAIRKIGPTHYGATAPNSVPKGQTGNATGETWLDSSTTNYYLKIWNGSTWIKVGSGFSDFATSASSASTAGFATTAGSATTANLASAAVISSGVAVTATLPASSPQGTVMYQAAAPSGLYVYVGTQWVPA